MSIELMQQVVTGTPITTAVLVTNEVPTGTANGVNTTFTLTYTPSAGTVQLYLRGQRLEEGDSTDGYTRTGLTLTIGSAITPPGATDNFLVDYRKA